MALLDEQTPAPKTFPIKLLTWYVWGAVIGVSFFFFEIKPPVEINWTDTLTFISDVERVVEVLNENEQLVYVELHMAESALDQEVHQRNAPSWWGNVWQEPHYRTIPIIGMDAIIRAQGVETLINQQLGAGSTESIVFERCYEWDVLPNEIKTVLPLIVLIMIWVAVGWQWFK